MSQALCYILNKFIIFMYHRTFSVIEMIPLVIVIQ